MPIHTKWPRLIVVGEPVTEDQADEILIRTAGWHYLASNDRAFTAAVEKVAAEFGRPIEPTHHTWSKDDAGNTFSVYYQDQRAWLERFRIIELGYLYNAQIVSSWIGGPHGWCDWIGTIGCTSHNIGKWPSDEEVTAEWMAIAAAFPFLDLTAQCIDDEGEGRLAAQWRVCDGRVEYEPEPTELLAAPTELLNPLRCLMPGGERGVSLERLRSALARVAAAVAE